MLYCIVARRAPSGVACAFEELHEPDAMCVIHDRRRNDRRRASRRHATTAVPAGDRRTIHGFDGRRVAERRAPTVEADPPRRTHELRGHAESVRYVERVAPHERDVADAELARLVLRAQGGAKDAIEAIYRRMFSDVYAYFQVLLGDHSEAEDASQQVFLSVLTALPGFQLRRGTPVRAWLFRIARHQAIKHLKRSRRHVVEEPEMLARRREVIGVHSDADALEWVTDPELLVLIDRLSPSQRQVLALRYMLGMRTTEVALVLEKTDQAVRHLESRALRFLRQRLAALGLAPAYAR